MRQSRPGSRVPLKEDANSGRRLVVPGTSRAAVLAPYNSIEYHGTAAHLAPAIPSPLSDEVAVIPYTERIARALVLLWLSLLAAGNQVAFSQASPSPQDIAARAKAAVVLIVATDSAGEPIGQGSGFLVAPSGEFITNYHVIEGASKLLVRLPSGEVFDNVYFLTSDVRRDLAILKIPLDTAAVIPLGSDRELRVGDRVYVLGNPLGLEGTFSDGMVSATRMIEGVAFCRKVLPELARIFADVTGSPL